MKINFHRFSIYQKIIIVFSALICFVYIISLNINILGSNFIKSQISNLTTSRTEYYSKNLGDEIARIRMQQQQLLSDNDLQRLSIMTNTINSYESFQMINRIKDRLITIKTSSPYIKNAGIYIKSINRTISTEYGINNAPNDEYQMLESYVFQNPKGWVYHTEGRFLLIEKYPVNAGISSRDLLYIVYIELSKSNIENAMKQFIDYKKSGVLLADNNLSWTMSSGDISSLAPEFEECLKKYDESGNDGDIYTVKHQKENYWVLCRKLTALDAKFLFYIPENEATGTLNRYNRWFIILSVASLIIIVVFALFLNDMIHKPLKKLISGFKSLELENLNALIDYDKKENEFGYLYKGFNNMVKRLQTSIEQVYEQKIAKQHSELRQLQAQINPHFLYNSFYHIYRMCKISDFDNVALFTQKLGSYYQFITRSGADEVPLQMEIKHLKNYIDIQGMRFVDRVEVEMNDIPEEWTCLMVPRLILQPVVENAFEHGLNDILQGGRIVIGISYENRVLYVTVEDNGTGMEESKLQELQNKMTGRTEAFETTGIINVNKRLRLKYGENSGLTVTKSIYGGIKIEIRIDYNDLN